MEKKVLEKGVGEHVKLSIGARIMNWFSRYAIIFILGLVGVVIGTILFYNFKINKIESEFAEQKVVYEKVFHEKMDSVITENAYQLSRVFSWSVRAELIRGNNEQVSLLFNQFIKTPTIKKIALINPKTKEIIIASDKKIEGEFLNKLPNLTQHGDKVLNNEFFMSISGLNEQIGVLNITYNLDENSSSQMKIK